MAIAPAEAHRRRADLGARAQVDRLQRVVSARAGVAIWLIAIAGLSIALRIVLLSEVHGPWVFMDELGYQKLAQSLGQNGHLALFDKTGLSLSPLYSVVLAPIYALGASAPAAYAWIKIVNAVLMSLSVVPIYKIARFVLPRRSSLVAAALPALAPLMYYSGLATGRAFALTGIYEGALKQGFPNLWRVGEQIVRHLAGLDLAVGVVPFVGALVAAYAFLKYGARREVGVFAAVAVSVTAWLLLEVGFFGDFVIRTAQIPRIHERYLFYLVPLLLVALLAAVRLPASKAPFRAYEAAAVVAAALPALIPFRSVINNTIVADSFSLQPYGKAVGNTIVPVGHATLGAVSMAGLLALVYVLLRN